MIRIVITYSTSATDSEEPEEAGQTTHCPMCSRTQYYTDDNKYGRQDDSLHLRRRI